ncbi:LytTR family DNA-binding domain-containing protein [Paenibacillus sp. R14(2021)]|uniref:LytR/AlgR family response regulator transcription factor n=1 Tax=Paenibacillus sp. R14(2021) TaxID=2859228 RepID=UPI001C61209D|nr:LytTR family transcriptional regulator DNA-binding domain-containing protein [Paenibacillus sp. R14(2021)]
MLKAFIVDDEPLAREELTYILRRSKRVEVIGEAGNVKQALEQIKQLAPDVVFLDIQLSEDSGMELAAVLQKLELRTDIVFATAYDEYALKAFELNAADYILKPFDEARIKKTVEKIISHRERQDNKPVSAALHHAHSSGRIDKLAISVEDRILLVSLSSILYISSAEGKTEIAVGDNRKYTVLEPLVAFEQKLLGTSIVRVHRAYLVNQDAIVEIQPWFHSTYNLIMKDGSAVPVSRTFIKELKHRIGF